MKIKFWDNLFVNQIEKAKELIDKFDIITFDMFDTLVIRPYINPYQLMKHIELKENILNFDEHRIKAESIARSVSTNEDITLDDIYMHMPKNFEYVKNIEIDYERKLIQSHLINY